MPSTIPSPRNNPTPVPQTIDQVEFLAILHEAFGGHPQEVNRVGFEVGYEGVDTVRKTIVERGDVTVAESNPTAIRRS